MIKTISILVLLLATSWVIKIFMARSEATKANLKTRKKKSIKGSYGYVREDKQAANQHTKEAASKNLFASVSIAHDFDSCETVQGYSNIRFLTKDAPLVPLKNCAKKHICNCKYIHHKDRRSASRRSSFNAGSSSILENSMTNDKRKSSGRRWGD